MIPGASIVIVDDDKEHLSSLCDCLNSMGHAVLPVLYEEGSPRLLKPLSTVQILFMDIHLIPAVPAGQPTYSIVASALEQIIAPDCGPYILITWSTHAIEHDDLMKYLTDSNIPAPAVSACLNKEEYLDADSGNADNLIDGIKKAVEETPQVDALMNWHNAARIASGEVINSLLRLVDKENRFTGKSGPELERLMTVIAQQGAGKNASDNLVAAMNMGLEPILVDRVLNATKVNRDAMEAQWKAAMPNVAQKFELGDDQIAALNTMTSISRHDIDHAKIGDRGIVSTLPFKKEEDFVCAFGNKREELLAQFVAIKGKADDSGEKEKLMNELAGTSFRFVGISAACDYSWGKTPIRKLMLAVEFPKAFHDKLRVQKDGAIYKTPSFELPKQRGHGVLIFNWRYCWTTAEKNIGGEKLCRLREPLISHLITDYHVHGFRPGRPEY